MRWYPACEAPKLWLLVSRTLDCLAPGSAMPTGHASQLRRRLGVRAATGPLQVRGRARSGRGRAAPYRRALTIEAASRRRAAARMPMLP